MEKNYRTVKEWGRSELIEKKSRFIGTAQPVHTEEEALALIQAVRKEFPDVRHTTYAYIVRDNNIARYSDGGEPGGTAGMPMMEVLKQEKLTDVAVVVTRYFGGILLGAGGLVRAYSKTAKLAVDDAKIAVMTSCTLLKITVGYEQYGRLQYLLEQEGLPAENADFGQNITVSVYVREELCEALIHKITEATNGRAACHVIGTEYRPLDVT